MTTEPEPRQSPVYTAPGPSPHRRRSFRVPLGFVAAALFLWAAAPTVASIVGGGVLVIIGEAIRFISSGTLKKFEGVTREGIYAFMRNPLYVGSFFIGCGTCLMGMNWIFAAAFFITYLVVYTRVIRREERYLVTRYGDEYIRYLDEVPRLLPRRLDLGAILAITSPARAIKNKEGKTLLGIAGLFIAMIVKLLFTR